MKVQVGDSVVIMESLSLSLDLTVVPNQQYSFSVQAVNAAGQSPFSPILPYLVPGTPLVIPFF